MRAVKGNRVYTISEREKPSYISRGFDITGDNGKVIAYGKGKSVSYDEYAKIKTELEKLQATEANNNSKPPEKLPEKPPKKEDK